MAIKGYSILHLEQVIVGFGLLIECLYYYYIDEFHITTIMYCTYTVSFVLIC